MFLQFLAESFKDVFLMDQPHTHPLFKKAEEQLKNLIPGVSLEDEHGVLKRAGVRHVILRTETALLLMSSVDEDGLVRLGKQIGSGAAADLIRNAFEERELIPASAEAFVSLWNYWDRTGGWGNLHLVDAGGGTKPFWRLKVENNFLATDDLVGTHRLCAFWRGYIAGVLSEALPRITEIMHNKLSTKERLQVALPAYHRVVEVVHEEDDNLTEDHFQIRFRPEQFSDARRALSNCQSLVREGDFAGAMARCRVAVRSVRDELGSSFDERLSRLGLATEIMEMLRRMLDRGEEIEVTKEMAAAWFSAANQFTQRLSASADAATSY